MAAGTAADPEDGVWPLLLAVDSTDPGADTVPVLLTASPLVVEGLPMAII